MIDEEKLVQITKFYYNLTRFNEAMKEYTTYLQTISICENRKKVAVTNEICKMKEEKEKEIKQWDKAITNSKGLADVRLQTAEESFDMLKSLLTA